MENSDVNPEKNPNNLFFLIILLSNGVGKQLLKRSHSFPETEIASSKDTLEIANSKKSL